MGDFNHPDINWEDHTARHTLSRRFLHSIDNNFLTLVEEDQMRRDVLLDLLLTNRDGLVEEVKVWGSLGCSDHDVVEFRMNCVEEAGQ